MKKKIASLLFIAFIINLKSIAAENQNQKQEKKSGIYDRSANLVRPAFPQALAAQNQLNTSQKTLQQNQQTLEQLSGEALLESELKVKREDLIKKSSLYWEDLLYKSYIQQRFQLLAQHHQRCLALFQGGPRPLALLHIFLLQELKNELNKREINLSQLQKDLDGEDLTEEERKDYSQKKLQLKSTYQDLIQQYQKIQQGIKNRQQLNQQALSQLYLEAFNATEGYEDNSMLRIRFSGITELIHRNNKGNIVKTILYDRKNKFLFEYHLDNSIKE